MVTKQPDKTYLTALRSIKSDLQEIKQMLAHIIETRCDYYYKSMYDPLDPYR